MRKKYLPEIVGICTYGLFVLVSFLIDFEPGKGMGLLFFHFGSNMFRILPCAFLLVGLFEVWIPRETVMRHLGHDSGLKGYMWAVLLASTMVGGLYVALPLAHSLRGKGASWSTVLAFLGGTTLCRVPMVIFEASFMGLKFTAIRLFVALPLVLVASMLLGKYLTKHHHRMIKC